MLTERPEFRAWLARHDAHSFAMQKYQDPARQRTADDCCGCCGGPIGDTPSQLEEECIICLAERFGGDQVEADMAKLLVGGLVRAAMQSEEIADELVVTAVTDAIREHEHEQGRGWGRGLERARKAAA